MTGSYSYIGPDGVLYEVEYIADENGFQPTIKHFPTYHSEKSNNVYLKTAFGQMSNFNGNDAPIPEHNLKNRFQLKQKS